MLRSAGIVIASLAPPWRTRAYQVAFATVALAARFEPVPTLAPRWRIVAWSDDGLHAIQSSGIYCLDRSDGARESIFNSPCRADGRTRPSSQPSRPLPVQ